jgi:hypothetical protein
LSNDEPTTLADLIALNDLVESDEDAEYITRQIEAIERADTETARQKQTLEILTQQAAAYLVSISTKHLRDQGAARNIDGTYNGRDLVEWLVGRKIDEARKDWERKSDKIDTARERQEDARADKLEIEALMAQGKSIAKEEVEHDLSIAMSRITNGLDTVPMLVANLCPADVKATVKEQAEDLVRRIQREMAASFS